jgi:hypothetical protein
MALLLAADTVLAQTGPANYGLLVGAGFLCDLGVSVVERNRYEL